MLNDGGDPTAEAGLEGLRFDARDHASERVVGGQAVGQVEVAFEPVLISMSELLDIFPAVGTTDRGADRDKEQVVEFVEFISIPSRVFEVAEVVKERRHGREVGLRRREPALSR